MINKNLPEWGLLIAAALRRCAFDGRCDKTCPFIQWCSYSMDTLEYAAATALEELALRLSRVPENPANQIPEGARLTNKQLIATAAMIETSLRRCADYDCSGDCPLAKWCCGKQGVVDISAAVLLTELALRLSGAPGNPGKQILGEERKS